MDEQLQKILNNVSFSVNAEKQTMDVSVLPHGEDKPISFHVNYKQFSIQDSPKPCKNC